MATPNLPAFLTQSDNEIHNKFIDLEWLQRDRYLQGIQQMNNPNAAPTQWSRITGDEIAMRNRYVNVEPWACNRIKLKVGAGASDYINASPIRLGKRRYIATQGPKDTSVNHFYRMLASETASPAVVVMLTQTHESGREKCFQYYPLTTEESPMLVPEDVQIGDGFQGHVDLVSRRDDAESRSELRTLRFVGNADDSGQAPHEIHHLLFAGWPDFTVPEGENRHALLKLIRQSAQLNSRGSSTTDADMNGSSVAEDLTSTDQDNPRIIHCSAGVGRSGTFIALDYLLYLLHSGQLDHVPPDQDLIVETVDNLRQQRMMMVQTEGQFNFLYDVLKEQFLARQSNRDAVAGAEAE